DDDVVAAIGDDDVVAAEPADPIVTVGPVKDVVVFRAANGAGHAADGARRTRCRDGLQDSQDGERERAGERGRRGEGSPTERARTHRSTSLVEHVEVPASV